MKATGIEGYRTPLKKSLSASLNERETADKLDVASRPPFRPSSTSKTLFGNGSESRIKGRIRKRPGNATSSDWKPPEAWGGGTEVERTVRWFEVARSLWAALVIDIFQDRPAPLKAPGFDQELEDHEEEYSLLHSSTKVGQRRRKDVVAFIDAMLWFVEGQISKTQFKILYTAWQTHCQGKNPLSHLRNSAESLQDISRVHRCQSVAEEEEDMFADLPWFRQHLWARGVGTQTVDTMLAAMLHESQCSLLNNKSFFPDFTSAQYSLHWIHLCQTLFFQLDANGYGALTMNELLHLVVANQLAENGEGTKFLSAEDLYLQTSVLTFEMATGRFNEETDQDLQTGEERAGLVTLPAWLSYFQRQIVTEDVLEAYIQVVQLILFQYTSGEDELSEEDTETPDPWGQTVREIIGSSSTLFKSELKKETCPTRRGAFFLVDAKPLLSNLSGLEAVSSVLLASFKDLVGGLFTDDHVESMALLIHRLITRYFEKIGAMSMKMEEMDSLDEIKIPNSVLLRPRCLSASKNVSLFEDMKWTYKGPTISFGNRAIGSLHSSDLSMDNSRRSRNMLNGSDIDDLSFKDFEEPTPTHLADESSVYAKNASKDKKAPSSRRRSPTLVIELGQGKNISREQKSFHHGMPKIAHPGTKQSTSSLPLGGTETSSSKAANGSEAVRERSTSEKVDLNSSHEGARLSENSPKGPKGYARRATLSANTVIVEGVEKTDEGQPSGQTLLDYLKSGASPTHQKSKTLISSENPEVTMESNKENAPDSSEKAACGEPSQRSWGGVQKPSWVVDAPATNTMQLKAEFEQQMTMQNNLERGATAMQQLQLSTNAQQKTRQSPKNASSVNHVQPKRTAEPRKSPRTVNLKKHLESKPAMHRQKSLNSMKSGPIHHKELQPQIAREVETKMNNKAQQGSPHLAARKNMSPKSPRPQRTRERLDAEFDTGEKDFEKIDLQTSENQTNHPHPSASSQRKDPKAEMNKSRTNLQNSETQLNRSHQSGFESPPRKNPSSLSQQRTRNRERTDVDSTTGAIETNENDVQPDSVASSQHRNVSPPRGERNRDRTDPPKSPGQTSVGAPDGTRHLQVDIPKFRQNIPEPTPTGSAQQAHAPSIEIPPIRTSQLQADPPVKSRQNTSDTVPTRMRNAEIPSNSTPPIRAKFNQSNRSESSDSSSVPKRTAQHQPEVSPQLAKIAQVFAQKPVKHSIEAPPTRTKQLQFDLQQKSLQNTFLQKHRNSPLFHKDKILEMTKRSSKKMRTVMSNAARQNTAAIYMQAAVRGFLVRSEQRKKRNLALFIQTWWKHYKALEEYQQISSTAACHLQRWARTWRQRRLFLSLRASIIQIQCWIRCLQAKKKTLCMWAEVTIFNFVYRRHLRTVLRKYLLTQKLIIQIQKVWRRYWCQKQYALSMMAVVIIQGYIRGVLARTHLSKQIASIKIIQRVGRRWLVNRWFIAQLSSTMITKMVRKYLVQKRFEDVKAKTILIQAFWRGHSVRKIFEEIVKATVCIQSFIRMVLVLVNKHKFFYALVRLQALWRAQYTCHQYYQLRATTITIQSYWRGYQARCKLLEGYHAISVLQRYIRRRIAPKILQKHKSTWVMQMFVRSAMSCSALALRKGALIVIQTWWRGCNVRRVVKRLLLLAVSVKEMALQQEMASRARSPSEFREVISAKRFRRDWRVAVQNSVPGFFVVSDLEKISDIRIKVPWDGPVLETPVLRVKYGFPV